MACDPEILRQVPLFALLDDEEMAVLASQVEIKKFARGSGFTNRRSRRQAYVMVSGRGARHDGR